MIAVGAACLLVGLVLWYQRVPLTASGKDCGARVFSFGPGMSYSLSEGNQSPAEIAHNSAECRAAAAPAWWAGATFLVLGLGSTGFGLLRGRQKQV